MSFDNVNFDDKDYLMGWVLDQININLGNNNFCSPYPDCIEDDCLNVQDTSECAVLGCTDAEACNYDSESTEDDGSCEYAEEFYDCDGNCIAEIDCAGECGGSAELDECGICDGEEECFVYSRELHEGANLVSALIARSPSSSNNEAAPEFQICINATLMLQCT